ncbi:MAG: phage tail protein [Deltaproteobacteria bacterium]|nr:phage tail protein [Deltaproteobacteria bacterium]
MSEHGSNGIVVGIVKDLDDPEGIGRVKVTYPHLADAPSDWARLATIMGGAKRGAFFRPEVNDEVLVAFEHGDPRRPCILGSLWSKVDQPPADDGDKKKNNWRFITSRSGHVIKLDDTANKERVEIVGKGGSHKVVIDVSAKKIQITCDTGDVEIAAPAGDIKVSAKSVQIKADTDMSVEAGGTLTIKGATVNIN